MSWLRKLFRRPVLTMYGVPVFKNGQVDGAALFKAHKALKESKQPDLATITAKLMAALEEIANPSNPPSLMTCDCEHDTDDCCAVAAPDYYCPMCKAGRALAEVKAAMA